MTHHHLSDDDLRAAFLARAGGAPSTELAERIRSAVHATRQTRAASVLPAVASSRLSGLAWAAALAALGIALVGALVIGPGRSSVVPPDATPSPTVRPSSEPSDDPSLSPAPSPSASPSIPSSPSADAPFIPAGLGPDRIAHVVATDGLRVRSLPTVAEASERLEPTLEAGVKLYVVAGPVVADGYAWYQVDPYGIDPGLTPFGWVAAGSRDGEPWIENLFDGCDTVGPSVELFASTEPQETLYCYGADGPFAGDVELTGDLYCDVGDVEGVFAGPTWVEFDRYCELRAPDWTLENGRSMRVWGQAATALLEAGAPVDGRYTVVGHVDDPGADACQGGGFDGAAPDPAEVILWCRMAFVATSVTPAD